MPRFRFIALLILLSCAVQFTGTGQTSYYRPQIFGTRDGLLSSKIYSLKQSHDRRLWIGTELGLSVYDGYSFTNFQYTTANETIGRVLCITEDKQNGIWIGGDKGLFYLHNGLIEKLSFDSRTSIAVEALLTDATGNIWVGDLEALYKIETAEVQSIRQKQKKIIRQLPFAEFTKRVFSIASDNKENIYLASFDGIFKINKTATSYETVWKNPDPVKFVRSVAAISPDSIVWNRLDGHPYEMRNEKTYTPLTESYIWRIVFTHRQKAYALTTSGVGKVKDGLVYPLVSFDNITNNAVAALIDEEENIWVGSWEGLQKFSKTSFKQYILQHPNQKETFSFLERKNGELLFGSNRGLVFTKKNESLIPHSNIPPLFRLAEVMCMYEDDEAALWAGSGYQGISRISNNNLTNWKANGFLRDDNCEALHPAPGSNLFACTENGVTIIDPQSNEPMIAHYSFQKQYTRPPELFGCFQTGTSGYWFYGSQGLYALHDSVLIDDSIINMPVRNLYINKIITDKKGNIWVATLGKGLLLCQLKNGKIVLQKQYDKSMGLTSDITLSVLADKNDNIWWGDYMSLSVLINPGNNEQIITYNEKAG